LKVLVASSSPPDRGQGITAYAKSLCEALVAKGVEVHFLSPEPRDRSWLEEFGIANFGADQDDDPVNACRALLQYIRDQGIDAAINNDNPYLQSIAPALPCRLLSVGHMPRRSVAALACHQHAWTDHVVTISSEMQSVYVRKYGVPPTKCPIVYCGVPDPGEPNNRAGAESRDAAEEAGDLRAVYAGGYTRNKGGKLLLEAVLAGPERWQGVQLDWFGSVPDAIASRVRDLPHVRIHGKVSREVLHETLSRADVFVLASYKEGCPMALLEAMSFGVVPICSDGVGAMRWLVTHGRNGFICQLDDFADQMIECLRHLRAHPASLNELKRASRASYLDGLRSDQLAERLLQLIDQPTVDRSQPALRMPILHWHRPMSYESQRSPLLHRICNRHGILRRAGVLDLAEDETPLQAGAIGA
jgi:glycosyltransferase involved in cell wall biosynthesis